MFKSKLGFSLIELLMAISLSSILLVEIMQLYEAAYYALQLQSALFTLKNNAENAQTILKTAIQQAGAIGCMKLTENLHVIPYGKYFLNRENRLRNHNSNELIVTHAAYPHANVLMKTEKNIIYANHHIRFMPKEIMLISDCKHAEIFAIKSVFIKKDKQVILPTKALTYEYEKFSELSRLCNNRFFVANTKRKYSNGHIIPALFVENIHGKKSELVDDVEKMELELDLAPLGAHPALIKGVKMKLHLARPFVKKQWHFYTALTN